jgi:transposase InsO family protein
MGDSSIAGEEVLAMSWMDTGPVEERMRFVAAVEAGEESISALCLRAGVSRKTGYKWLERWRKQGVEGLFDRSRAPSRRAWSMDASVAQACLEVRRTHPTWGPLKVKGWLEHERPGPIWPAASSIGALFDREGLTVKRRLRRRGPPSTTPFAGCAAPNDLWCMDFKGWFRTGDGKRCDPFTLCDAASRYLLRCQVMDRCDTEHVWPVLDAAFREFGLPRALRSDNGPPFASAGAGGLSRLSVMIIKAGVTPDRIEPGKPQQNGRLERFHLTLLGDAASPPAQTLAEQKKRFAAFRQTYNEQRPHQALGSSRPAEVYTPSTRRWDGILREPHYEPDEEVRRVRSNGEIKWRGKMIYLGQALIGEWVGLSEVESGWAVRYARVPLGVIPQGADQLKLPKRRARGDVDNPAGSPHHHRLQSQQQS